MHVADPEAVGEGSVLVGDCLEARPVPAHEVHLVDGEDHVADAEQGDDEAVAVGLGRDPPARIDEDDGRLRGRGTGRHVPGVLLVARGVGDDEPAPRGREVAVGDVDGDALLALGLEPVQQEGEVEVAFPSAELPAVGGGGRELVLRDEARVVEQPADEGRLAVVHPAARDEPEEVLLRLGGEEGVEVPGTRIRPRT